MRKAILMLVILAGFGCSSENSEQNQENTTDTTNMATGVDSVKQKTLQDGTLVMETIPDDRRELPPDLKLLLDSVHPGWELPEVDREAMEQALDQPQGPFFVAGYFNPDLLKDYAIQIVEGTKIQVIAIVNRQDSTRMQQVLETEATAGNGNKPLSPLSILPGDIKSHRELFSRKNSSIPEPHSFKVINQNKYSNYFYTGRKNQLFYRLPMTGK